MPSTISSPYVVVSSLPNGSSDSLGSSLEAEEVHEHPHYRFYDDNVTFLVEKTLFTVHKYFFARDSDVFREMFLLPPPPGQVVEGSREKPICLYGVSRVEFERFLSVMYPPQIGVDPFTTTEEWASALSFADKFNFIAVRELSIRRILDIASPVDKIIIGHKFALRPLSVSGYKALCSRYNSLTLEEGIRLGMEDVILISSVREAIREADYVFSNDFLVEKYFGHRLPMQ